MNVAVQDLHTVIGGGQEARRQGRPRWALPRRHGRHGLCHVGLQREARSRSTVGSRVHRRGQQPHTRSARRRRRACTDDRRAGHPRAPGARSAVGVSVAELRRDHGALRRRVQRHGVGCGTARSQRALSWARPQDSSPATSSRRSGSPTSASTATRSTLRRRPRRSRRHRHTSEKVCRPRARSTGGTGRGR